MRTLLIIAALTLGACSSSQPAQIAQLEPVTVDHRQPIERLAVCEEVFMDGGEAQDCYIVLSLTDKLEEVR